MDRAYITIVGLILFLGLLLVILLLILLNLLNIFKLYKKNVDTKSHSVDGGYDSFLNYV